MAQFRGVELDDLVLTGEQVVLRPWRPDDAPAVVAAMRDGSIAATLGLPDPYTDSDALEFVTVLGRAERADGTGLDCAVVDRTSGVLVGAAGIRLPFGTRQPDIGYWIDPAAQRRGYATDATRTLADWAYSQAVHRIEVRTDVGNIASALVALRSGFAFEAVQRAAVVPRGAAADTAVFVRTPADTGTPVPKAFAPLPADGLRDGTITLQLSAPDDLDAVLEMESDERTVDVGFTGTAVPRERIAPLLARARLDLLVGQAARFTIVDDASGRYAGGIHLRTVGPPGVGLIGYAVHPAFRGRGFTTRALRLVAPWAFEQVHLGRLELGAKVDNVASQRAALSAGFEPDGVMHGRLRNADGSYSDEARFALLNPQLPSRISP